MRIYHYLRKRGLALFMALIMCLSLLPVQAMAAEPADGGDSNGGQWELLTVKKIRLLVKDASSFTVSQLVGKELDGKKLIALGTSSSSKKEPEEELPENTILYISDSGFTMENPAADSEPDPEPEVTYTVTYTDGAENEDVFADQKHEGLELDAETPAFDGTPTREGYTFTGWDPKVAENVTGDVTYTAQWEEEEVDPATYTVTYTDGVEDEDVFADQVISDLKPDAKTPAFDGTPTREGYTFAGWDPKVAENVTGDVTYTAQWEKEEADPTTYTVTYGSESRMTVEENTVITINLNGGTWAEETALTLGEDSTYTVTADITLPDPEQDGYIFDGWTLEDTVFTATWETAAEDDEFAENDMETLSLSVTSNAASEPQQVYLWALFGEDKSSAGRLSLMIDRVNSKEELTDDSKRVDLVPDANVTLVINVDFREAPADSTKKVSVYLPQGVAVRQNSLGNENKALTQLEHTPVFDADPDTKFASYQPESGTVTCTFKTLTEQGGVRIPIYLDKVFWNRGPDYQVKDPIKITAYAGEEIYDERSIIVGSTSSEGYDNVVVYTNGNAFPLLLKEPKEGNSDTFSLYRARFTNNTAWESADVTVSVPYVLVGGEPVYAEVAGATWESTTWWGTWEVPSPVEGTDTEGHKTLTYSLEGICAKGAWPTLTPKFQLPADQGIKSGDQVHYGRICVEGKLYCADTQQLYEKNFQRGADAWNKVVVFGDEQVSVSGDLGKEGFYNWFNYDPDLRYEMSRHYFEGHGLNVSNNGRSTSGAKTLEIHFNTDQDMMFAVSQQIPVPADDDDIRIEYTVVDEAGQNEQKETLESVQATGTLYRMSRTEDMKANGLYFKTIKVTMSKGYPAGYKAEAQTLVQARRALTGEERTSNGVSIEPFMSWTIDDNTTPGKNWQDPSTGKNLNRAGQKSLWMHNDSSRTWVDVSLDMSCRNSTDNNAELRAGTGATLTAVVSPYPYRYSESHYLHDPILYLRLPVEITLDRESIRPVIRKYASGNKGAGEILLGKDAYTLEQRQSKDGKYNIYAFAFKDGKAAIGRFYQDDYLYRNLSLSVDIFAGLECTEISLPANKTLFISSPQELPEHYSTKEGATNARPHTHNGDPCAPDLDPSEIDFLRNDWGEENWEYDWSLTGKTISPYLSSAAQSIPVRLAVEGIVFYKTGDDTNLYYHNEEELSFNFNAWNNTDTDIQPGLNDASVRNFVSYIPIPKTEASYDPTMLTKKELRLAFAGMDLNGHDFLKVEYTTEQNLPQYANYESIHWVESTDFTGELDEVTMVRVTASEGRRETFLKGDKLPVTLKLKVLDQEQLILGQQVAFNGRGVAYGKQKDVLDSYPVYTDTIRLTVAGSIEGKILKTDYTEGNPGAPVPNVKVLLKNGDRVVDQTETDNNGAYIFKNLTDKGPYVVEAVYTETDELRFVSGEKTRTVTLGDGADRFATAEPILLEEPHTVTFRLSETSAVMDGKAPTATEPVEVKKRVWHGESLFAVPNIAAYNEYKFLGWQKESTTEVVTTSTVKSAIITSSVTYNAVLTDKTSYYTVQYFYDGMQKDSVGDRIIPASSGEVISADDLKESGAQAGYRFDHASPATLLINPTATNLIKLYYVWDDGNKGPELTVTANSAEYYYDGAEHTVSGFVGQEENGDIVVNGYTISGLRSTAKATDVWESVKQINFTQQGYTVLDENGNNVTSHVTLHVNPGYLIIKPRTVTLVSPTTSWPYDGKEHPAEGEENEVTVSPFNAGTGAGFVTGEGFAEGTLKATGKITNIGFAPNLIVYTLNDSTKAGNYTVIKQEGTLSVTPRPEEAKFEVTVTAKSLTDTYDGTEKSVSGFENEVTGKGIAVEANGQTYYITGLTSEAKGTNVADSCQATVSGSPKVVDAAGKNVTSEFLVKVTPGKLTINKRPVILTSADLEQEYNGTALTNGNKGLAAETGWVAGQGASYTFTGSQTQVGTSANAFTYTLNDGTNANNYDITKTEGTLKVTNRNAQYNVTVTVNSGEFTYDGQPHTVRGFVGETYLGIPVTAEGQTYYVTGLTAEATGINVTDSVVELNAEGDWDVKDAAGNSVKDQFNVTVTPGALTIKPRPVTLRSLDAERTYDGTPLTKHEVSGEDGFVSGQGATYTFTGSQTLVGESDNTFSYTLKEGTDASNYNIQTVSGKLKVNSRFDEDRYEVTVTGESKTVKYDGNKHFVGGTITQTVTANGQTYTVTVETTKVEETNAGKYLSGVKKDSEGKDKITVTDKDGRDVTGQFIVKVNSPALEITKRSVILTSATASMEYNSTALKDERIDVGGDGFAEKDNISYDVTGEQTNVGSSENKFSWKLNGTSETNPEELISELQNYTITKRYGTLTVTNRSENAKYEITVQAKSDTVIYNGQKHVIDSFTVDGSEGSSFERNGHTFYIVSGVSVETSGTNAGTYTANVKVENAVIKDGTGDDATVVTDQFIIKPVSGQLVIQPRPVTLTSGSASKPYDGSPLTAAMEEPSTTANGNAFIGEDGVDCTVTGSQTQVGISKNTFTWNWKEGTADETKSNYAITTKEGTLNVTQPSALHTVEVKAADKEVKYDGTTWTVRNEFASEKGLTFTWNEHAYTITGLTALGCGTDAGKYDIGVTGTAVVTDEEGKDVSGQFNIQPVEGILTITQREITLTSATADKPYDGKPLTAKTVKDTGDGFVNGQGVTCEVTGSRIFPGESDNSFTYTLTGGATEKNYKITKVEGKLKVTGLTDEDRIPVTVTADDMTVVYDGTEYTMPVNITEEIPWGEQTLTVTVTAADVKGTNAGEYAVPENGYTVQVTAKDGEKDVDVTGQCNVNVTLGKLIVSKRPVTVTVSNAEKFYGEADPTFTGEIEEAGEDRGLVAGDDLKVSYVRINADVDGVGTYEEVLDAQCGNSNYDVTVEKGNFTIKPASIPGAALAVSGGSWVYNGASHGVTVTGAPDGYTVQYSVNGGEWTAEAPSVTNIADGRVTVAVKATKTGYVDLTANDVTLEITPAELTVTTDSASRTYNGRALTAPGRISGLVNNETVTFTVTGSQIAVGSSENTYSLVWNGTAKETNYTIKTNLGTLRVTSSGGGGGGGVTPTPTPTPTPIPDNPTPLDPGTALPDQNVPLAGAVGLNNTDHFAYIAGYENNTVRPTANITRAEVAAIFFRLMTEEFRVANWSTENTFSDVKASDWYNNAISTCVKAGIIKGYEDGTFRPGQSITRAEFAAIAARFLGPDADDEGVGDFSDTAGKWYSADVRKAAKAGWILGNGNRFEPDANISRAQVMAIVNRMLDRTPDADHMLPTMKTWIDNPEGTWYYVDVQEATNGHDYTRDETNVETWTAIQSKKNWVEIEAEWAANNGASAPKNDAQPAETDGETK